MAKRQIEIPVHNNSVVTSRSLNTNHPNNLNLYETSLEFQDLLKEVKIRFDTNPKCYLREDYLKLIELLRLVGSGSGNIEIDVQGNGNVITDLNSNNNTIIATKSNVSEVTPDYAFWQKEYVKKGAEVLWVPNVNNNVELEVIQHPKSNNKKTSRKKVLLNFETRGNHKIDETWLEIAKRESDRYIVNTSIFKNITIVDNFNGYIKFRIGITDIYSEDGTVTIYAGESSYQYNIVNKGYFEIPLSHILNFKNYQEIVVEINDYFIDHPILYIALSNYFASLPTKNCLYLLKWENTEWKLNKLNETHIKCKYHLLSVDLHNYNGVPTIDRSTWRIYREPKIEIHTKYSFGETVKRDSCTISIDSPSSKNTNSVAEFDLFNIDFARENIDPDLNTIKFPDTYFVYQRRSCTNYGHYGTRNRTRTLFRWVLYCDDANRLPSVFTKFINRIKTKGIVNTLIRNNWIRKLIGSHNAFNGGIIHILIPVGYSRKSQSTSWINRSTVHLSEHKNRVKIFYKNKIACLRVIFRYAHRGGYQLCIHPEKVPFIMPKICY